MLLRVRSITYLAEAVNGYELVDPRGRDLPRFAAGAHIGVRFGTAPARDYSLWNDPVERRHYCIAILREDDRNGVSAELHRSLRVGDLVEVSWPRNNFPIDDSAERHLLIAGGIGITPIMAMIAELRRRGADFLLHYCARTPEAAAFRDDLELLAAQGRVRFHYDGGDPARGFDLAAALEEPTLGTHLYYCGPAGLMAGVAAAAANWPRGSVHCEYFTGPSDVDFAENRPFRVALAKSGGEYAIGAGETIIDVLRREGVAVRTSCELGYCGTCLTRYIAGEPEHRDRILTAKDRECYVLICCARSKTPVLTLDL
ncbi:MAG TPA: PDR/VanB family oxidoreductase [Stellaceae bacterium]|jgi:vanillate O-demethylase ferredoxin subunit|nr:PDR/VanB family oxidoreductase [Stellaceae bacterium]